jgi:hypothetical protein
MVADRDYLSTYGTVYFAPNQTTKTVTVGTYGDTKLEAAETLKVNLSDPVGTGIVDETGIGTIKDDDSVLAISDTGVFEGNPGDTQKATFTVHRTGPTTSPATVKYKTVEGSANKFDYTEVVTPATLTIPAGQSDQQLTVAIRGDATAEGHEGFSVALSSPSGVGVIEDGTAEATILNDDAGALIVVPLAKATPARR